ncbi:hypothetical protein R11007_02899 [Ralstonia holmesii]|nr:hypothetical protein R11007_02899 [Ralstonia sp. LMG 32967]
MWLTSHNVPFDVAFSMDDTWRTALAIILSEQESGKEFDFARREFVSRT